MMMAYTVFFIVLIFESFLGSSKSATTVAYNGAGERPPSLSVSSSTINIREGGNTTVTCKAREAVVWNPRGIENSTVDGVKDGIHTSTLVLLSVRHSDTGYLSCKYRDQIPTASNQAKIYLFVNSDSHLFFENYHQSIMLLPVYEGRTAIVPCKPNDEKTYIRLAKEQGDMLADVINRPGVTYDPRKGFELNPVDSFYNGAFDCTASLGNRTDSIYIHLLYHPNTASVPIPTINKQSAQHVTVNGSFTLTCQAKITTGTKLAMEWDQFPADGSAPRCNNSCLLQSSRVRITDPMSQELSSRDGGRYEVVKSSLTVTHVRKSDAGRYRCFVIDHSGKNNSVSENITVFAENILSHVKLTAETSRVEIVVGRTAFIQISVRGYPLPTLKWFHQPLNGSAARQVRDDGRVRINSEMYGQTGKSSIRISSVDRSDAGDYVLYALTQSMNDTATVSLVVYPPENFLTSNQELFKDIFEFPSPDTRNVYQIELFDSEAPFVSVMQSPVPEHGYYRTNQTYSLTCKSHGFPAPVVDWEFQQCSDIYLSSSCHGQPNPDLWSSISKSGGPNVVDFTTYNTSEGISMNLTVLGKVSGWYRCKAENTIDITNVYMEFLLTEITRGYRVGLVNHNATRNNQEQQPDIVEMDSITILALTNKYNVSLRSVEFNGVEIARMKRARVDQELETFWNWSNARLDAGSTEYTHVWKFHIDGITIEQSGVFAFHLIVRTQSGMMQKTVEIPVFVKRQVLPKLINHPASHTEVNVGETFTLNCTTHGVPKPTMRWMKDGEWIDASSPLAIYIRNNKETFHIEDVLKEHEGQYSCVAENRVGATEFSSYLQVQDIATSSKVIALALGISFVGIGLIVLTVLLVLKCRQDKLSRLEELRSLEEMLQQRDEGELNPELPIDDQVDLLPYDKRKK